MENFGAYYMEMKKREVVTAKKKVLEEKEEADAASGKVQREKLAHLLKVFVIYSTETKLDCLF